jgi:hypothetical protein
MALTTMAGGTLRIRIRTKSIIPILTPEKTAVIHRLTGTKYRRVKKARAKPPAKNNKNIRSLIPKI